MASRSEQDPISNYRLICGVITTMPLVYMLVAYILRFVGALPAGGLGEFEPEAEPIIALALIAAGVSSSVLSLFLKKFILARVATESSGARERFQATLVSLAVAESGAVLGLLMMLLLGNPLYGGLLCGLSFAVACFHFPSRYWLEHGDAVE